MTHFSFSQTWTLLNILIAVWVLLSISQAEAAVLQPSISVTGDVVTLGDLFDDAGEASDIVIATSPRPGVPTAISVSRISQVARRNGIAWRNNQSLTRVVVSRTGIPINPEATHAVVADAIARQHPHIAAKGEIEVVLANSADRPMVTEGELPSISVEQLNFDLRTGGFRAIVRAPANDPSGTLFRVSGRAFPALDVPVLTQRMSAGDKISGDDIQWVRVPATRVSQNIIDNANDLIGFTPRRGIRPGELIRRSDVEPPRLVEKGAIVSITYVIANMSLSSRGRALEDGALGETIRVLNERSHRTIDVEVTGTNEARIVPTRPVQLSALN
jgi:flagellar basal body P-ring formation protein FlgA